MSALSKVLDGTGTLFVLVAAALGVIAADRFLASAERRVTWYDLTIGLLGAAIVVGRTELRTSDFRGKKKHLPDRLVNAFSHGVAWRMAGGFVGMIGG